MLGEQVRDVAFRRWAKCHFCHITVGNDHIVHIKLNNRKENAKNNINKNIHSLPVLVREDMYRVFCLAHLDVSHKKVLGTYDKLRSEWGNINKNIVKYFCEKCTICAVHVNRKFSSGVAEEITSSKDS